MMVGKSSNKEEIIKSPCGGWIEPTHLWIEFKKKIYGKVSFKL